MIATAHGPKAIVLLQLGRACPCRLRLLRTALAALTAASSRLQSLAHYLRPARLDPRDPHHRRAPRAARARPWGPACSWSSWADVRSPPRLPALTIPVSVRRLRLIVLNRESAEPHSIGADRLRHSGDSAVVIVEIGHRRMASRPHHVPLFDDAIADSTAQRPRPGLSRPS